MAAAVIVLALSGGAWVPATPWEAWDAPAVGSAVEADSPAEDSVALEAVASAAAELLDLGKKAITKKSHLLRGGFFTRSGI